MKREEIWKENRKESKARKREEVLDLCQEVNGKREMKFRSKTLENKEKREKEEEEKKKKEDDWERREYPLLYEDGVKVMWVQKPGPNFMM